MTEVQWFTLGTLAVAATLCVANGVLLWLNARRLWRVLVLNRLLQNICVNAFAAQHLPVFTAWAQSTGNITVKVHAVRRDWSEG